MVLERALTDLWHLARCVSAVWTQSFGFPRIESFLHLGVTLIAYPVFLGFSAMASASVEV